MRPEAFDVCQRLTVESNCIPGSPHIQVASAMARIRSRARYRLTGSPLTTDLVHQSLSSATACMKSSVTRTLLLAFWKKIDE